MASIVIRDARLEDLRHVAEVFRSASLSNDGDREALLARPEFLEFDARAIVEGRVRLAEIDGVVVGFATGLRAGSDVEVEDLFVVPDQMRKGIATRLVADLADRSRAAGASRLVVTTNLHAQDFYRHAGFRGWDAVDTELGVGRRMSRPL